MTTETQEPEATDEVEGDATAPPGAADDGGSGAASEPRALPAPEPEPDPVRDRLLVPLLVPLGVVGGLVFYVLNVSRVFLATGGGAAVAAATVMTIAILAGAAVLSSAPKLRTSTIALTVVAVLVVVTGAGWLTVGESEEHGEGEVSFTPVVARATLESGNLYFRGLDPDTLPVGVTEFTIDNVDGTHTFEFDDPQVQVEGGRGDLAGPGEFSVAVRFPAAGEFTFFCGVTGHRAAGMEGSLTVDESLPAEPIDGGGGPAAGEEPAP
jgi:plastocyanin